MSRKKIIYWVVILVTIDQLIKIIIYHYFFDIRFDFIPSLLGFHPKFNDKFTNYLFKWEIGREFYIVIVLILQCIITLYFFKQKKTNNLNILNYVLIFFEAGAICAFLSFFYKNGCLDYLYLNPLFIFDLKDVYLTIFACLFPIYGAQKYMIKRNKYNQQNNSKS
jgi:lipoprotein signal peptidase